jgi:hypothetical protein
MTSNDPSAIRNIGLSEDLLRAAKTDLPFAALLEAQSRIVDLMESPSWSKASRHPRCARSC